MTKKNKESIKKQLIKCLCSEKEINKIVLFGSFIESESPNDIDVAIYQNSNEKYLTLAMKYRKLTRKIAKIIPLDIIPIKSDAKDDPFFSEIESGELIYEK